MSFLDPFILFFKNGSQLAARRRVAIGSGLTAVDDPTNDQLVLSAPAQAGSLLPPRVVTVSGADHTFNGTGAGGAVQLYPQTILFAHVDASVATFDFNVAGVEAGWTVFFSVEGVGGVVVVRNMGGEVPTPILVLNTNSTARMVGIYFDGDDWVPLQAGSGGTGAIALPGKIVTAPSYTIDSGTTKDSFIFLDWSANDIAITLPPHAAGVFRLLVFKAAKYDPTHHLTILRNGGTGKINHIPADLTIGYTRDFTWLCSNGTDDWCDLVLTGT